jgi:hypothetical protein
VETPAAWHATRVLVRVHCPKCGAGYETTLPVKGVRRVRRCAVCNKTGLEVIDTGDPPPDRRDGRGAAPAAHRADDPR